MLWDNFVAKSKNATFLFFRDFMEYHQLKFEDYSMLVFKDENLIAVCPANIVDNIVYSHQGLTYGGLLLTGDIKFKDVLIVWKEILNNLCSNGISQLILKTLPKIYHLLPSDEIDYLLFKTKATLNRRDVLSVLKLDDKKFSKNRIEGIKRGKRHQLKVKEVNDFSEFWNKILIPNLRNKHHVNPVHTLKEIHYLKNEFNDNIRQFDVYLNNEIVAGTTIFETKQVVHSQYISANSDKNQLGSLDFLFDYLLNNVFVNKCYFDFGSSNENEGQHINPGLLFWKEGFGARSISHDFYSIETKNYVELNDVML